MVQLLSKEIGYGLRLPTFAKSKFDYLRVDLLDCILEDLAAVPATPNRQLAIHWVESAIHAAVMKRPNWIIQYFLRLATNALQGKRHAADVRCEIEFALLEFSS